MEPMTQRERRPRGVPTWTPEPDTISTENDWLVKVPPDAPAHSHSGELVRVAIFALIVLAAIIVAWKS